MNPRPDKIKKIRKDYNDARRKGKDHNESVIYSVEQNTEGTAPEFFTAIYPLHVLSLKPESTDEQIKLFGKVKFMGAKEMWRVDKHKIVEDARFPDHRIIGVKRKIKQLNGIIKDFQAQGFAVGQDALNAVDRRRATIKGIEKEIADYLDKAADKNLPRRLAAAKRKREKEIQ